MPSDASGSAIAARFLALHRPGQPLRLPNPWDLGSARVLTSLGFAALATTSSGFAASLGRPDGSVTRDLAIEHAARIARATAPPVSADLENGFADEPQEAARTVTAAIDAGLAGCSIEDFTGRDDDPIYDVRRAVERVARWWRPRGNCRPQAPTGTWPAPGSDGNPPATRSRRKVTGRAAQPGSRNAA